MDSPQAPTPPDPTVTANAQGAANIGSARETARLNRPDQVTPYGSLRWTQADSRVFDQSGYDKALATYNTASPGAAATAGTPGTPDSWGGGNPESGGEFVAGTPGTPGTAATGPSATTGTAPDRAKFYSGNPGEGQWTSRIVLDPRVQAILDSQMATSQGLTGSIDSALKRTTDTLGNAIDYGALPSTPDIPGVRQLSAVPGAMQLASTPQALGSIATPGAPSALSSPSLPTLPGLPNVPQAAQFGQLRVPDFQNINAESQARLRQIDPNLNDANYLADQSSGVLSRQVSNLDRAYANPLNYNGAPQMPQADARARRSVEEALYGQATSRLDPKFNQNEAAMRSALMNRGITEGSPAWQQEMDNFGRSKNDAYTSAQNSAIAMGGEEMQRQFGMNMQSRQQGVGEANYLRDQVTKEAAATAALNSGNVSNLNSLLNTQISQGSLSEASTMNDFRRKAENYNMEAGQFDRESQQQSENFSRQKDQFEMESTNAARLYGMGTERYKLAMQARTEQFGMDSQQYELQAKERDKQYSMQTSQSDREAQRVAQAYGMQSSTSDREAQRAAQAYGMETDQYGRRVAARSNALSEQERRRALVLNELSALRSGSQVAMPQFQSGNSGATVAPAPFAQSAYNSYQGQLGQYNSEVGSNNAMIGGAASLGAAGLGAYGAATAAASAAASAAPLLAFI